MAVTLSYQAWTAASYAWNSSTSQNCAAFQINEKLKSWIQIVNDNPSNASRRATIVKDPADTTSFVGGGWILDFDSPIQNSNLYIKLVVNSNGNISFGVGVGYSPGTGDYGYGFLSGSSTTDTNNLFYVSSYPAEFTIATDDTDGQEFFALGWRLDNTMNNSDYFLIFKDVDGEWCCTYNDANIVVGSYVMTTHPSPRRYFGGLIEATLSHTNGGTLNRYVFYNSNTGDVPTTNAQYKSVTIAAGSNLFMAKNFVDIQYGRWGTLVTGERMVNIGRNLYVKLPAP